MTTDYTKLAVYDINAFLWQKLQDAGLFNSSDYYVDSFGTSLVPIIPAQQIPEFNNQLPGKSYIIYDYEVKPTVEHWWITEEIITYTIVSQNYDKLNQTLNFIQDTLRRYDDTAKDLNKYLYGSDTPFDYHFIYTDRILSPQHFQNEGGFMMGEAVICISYARHLDNTGRFQ
jgi:hypothetical protein